MKKLPLQPVKNLKKVFYRGRITKFKKLLTAMIAGGLVLSILFFCYTAYVQYAVASAHLILSYPEIAEAEYPDGSRFTYYDLIGQERLKEALELLQSENKYRYYKVEDLADRFHVQSFLSGSASSDVSAARSEGDDYSYVANEYIVTYVQPHDYGNPNFFEKIFSANCSEEFLQALADINKKHIAEEKSGKNGFNVLRELDDLNRYDYDEKVKVYRTKIRAIMSYLRDISKKAPKFVSEKHQMSLDDVRGRYELLISHKVDSISDFIDSSGVSQNAEVASNKLRVNLENDHLKYNKAVSKAEIQEYAINNYDHTFTENLINVIWDQSQGLYQARPKTSFDSVVDDRNKTKEDVAHLAESIKQRNDDLARAYTIMSTEWPVTSEMTPDQIAVSEEKQRLTEKCDAMFAELDEEFKKLTDVASEIVAECLGNTNQEYVNVTVERESLFTMSLLIKCGIMFFGGAVIAFVLSVFFSLLSDQAELRKKKKLLRKIQETEKGA